MTATIFINKLSPLYRDFVEFQHGKAAIDKKLIVKNVFLDYHTTSKSIELASGHLLSLLLNISKIEATSKVFIR